MQIEELKQLRVSPYDENKYTDVMILSRSEVTAHGLISSSSSSSSSVNPVTSVNDITIYRERLF